MASQFLNVRFHAAEKDEEELRNNFVTFRGEPSAPEEPNVRVTFNNDESAARFYLGKIFERDARSAVRGLTAPDRSEVVPDLRFLGIQTSPLTKTRLVRFDQTRASIPIFGSQAVVELDEKRQLVSIDAEIVEIKGVSRAAALSPLDALQGIVRATGVTEAALEEVRSPELTFYYDEKSTSWHLAYFFKAVPAAPKGFLELARERKSHGHGLGRSPRERQPELNYLVDAHSGEILLYYSANPMLDVPSKCRGLDEENNQCEFFGRQIPDGFEMNDPLRAIRTYDLQLNDLARTPLPGQPVANSTNDWSHKSKAAVSAHVNAVRVHDFYKSVLMRDSIDDRGMDLVSIVNCTSPEDESPPEWRNAAWWKNRMWYGQVREGDGTLRSFSRYLDVIAHELTHGVTESTAGLVYQGQSGALNESFSDIFGAIIKNWHKAGPDADVGSWDWEIGSALGRNGLPLRDLSDPGRTGDPDHMNDYLRTDRDNGGVHTNSNIHNKAAYNVLTATDAAGRRQFTSREVAILYYLCLTRLNSLATFSKVLQVLTDVATTFYGGDAGRQKKVEAIKEAYRKVGIT